MDLAALLRWLEPSWHRDAECRDHPETNSYPSSFATKPRAAIEICARCRVRAQCLDAALDLREFNDLDGSWGGTTPGRRVHLRRARAAAPAQGPPQDYARLLALWCGAE